MRAVLDPHLVIWGEADLGDECAFRQLGDTLIAHLEELLDRKGKLLACEGFSEILLSHMPFGDVRFYPRVAEIGRWLQSFLTKHFGTLVEPIDPQDEGVLEVTVEPDIVPSHFDAADRTAYETLIVHLGDLVLRGRFVGRFLSHTGSDVAAGTLNVRWRVRDTRWSSGVKVIRTASDWDQVSLEMADCERLDGCVRAARREASLHSTREYGLVVAPSFYHDLKSSMHGDLFGSVIETLAKLKYGHVDKGLGLKKMGGRDEWRAYVNKDRGDRVHFRYGPEGIILLRYYPPGKHDEYKVSRH